MGQISEFERSCVGPLDVHNRVITEPTGIGKAMQQHIATEDLRLRATCGAEYFGDGICTSKSCHCGIKVSHGDEFARTLLAERGITVDTDRFVPGSTIINADAALQFISDNTLELTTDYDYPAVQGDPKVLRYLVSNKPHTALAPDGVVKAMHGTGATVVEAVLSFQDCVSKVRDDIEKDRRSKIAYLEGFLQA